MLQRFFLNWLLLLNCYAIWKGRKAKITMTSLQLPTPTASLFSGFLYLTSTLKLGLRTYFYEEQLLKVLFYSLITKKITKCFYFSHILKWVGKTTYPWWFFRHFLNAIELEASISWLLTFFIWKISWKFWLVSTILSWDIDNCSKLSLPNFHA